MQILKVAKWSRVSAVAGAIAGQVREEGRAEVQAIGPYAVNQAIKAVAVARRFLAEEGLDIICSPGFVEVVTIDGEERTAVRITVEPREPPQLGGEQSEPDEEEGQANDYELTSSEPFWRSLLAQLSAHIPAALIGRASPKPCRTFLRPFGYPPALQHRILAQSSPREIFTSH